MTNPLLSPKLMYLHARKEEHKRGCVKLVSSFHLGYEKWKLAVDLLATIITISYFVVELDWVLVGRLNVV